MALARLVERFLRAFRMIDAWVDKLIPGAMCVTGIFIVVRGDTTGGLILMAIALVLIRLEK